MFENPRPISTTFNFNSNQKEQNTLPDCVRPRILKGWRIARVTLSRSPGFTNGSYDLLEIWRGEYLDGVKQDAVWHDGYVSDTSRWRKQATIFDDYYYAEAVALMIGERWKGSEFVIIPVYNSED